MNGLKSAEALLAAYANGERYFTECELDGCSLKSTNLSGATFLKSFMSSDFRGANLEGVHFEQCNLKTATFQNANLKDAVITGCSVEGIDCKGATIENLNFNQNYYMGSIMQQSDLEGFC